MHSDEDRDRGDADDEGDDEEESMEEEEDEVDPEEEPRLKYQRMGGNIPTLLSADTASSICISDRMIALGTHGGAVHLLDVQGNQTGEFSVHTATVNELSFDADMEYVGSCSDDGTVVITNLYSRQSETFSFHRPMQSVALDPDYCKTKRFACGGLAGVLTLKVLGWFGSREDQVLHSGEGPIHAIKWRTSLIAWANDEGVKLFDTALQQRLNFIQRPKNCAHAGHLGPHLVWKDDDVLLIGWGNCITVAAIRAKRTESRDPFSFGKKLTMTKYVEIVASLTTDYCICGLAPYGESVVVLAYIDKEDGRTGPVTTSSKQTGHAQRPEVCILTLKNEELASDALPILGYEHYKANDYGLAHVPFHGKGGQFTEDGPLYYIVSPKDVVVARQRDAADHVQWLLEHGFHERALEAVETNVNANSRIELLDEVGSQYLDHLILGRQYAQAASLCPKVLGRKGPAWERWVYNFGQLRQLHLLANYIPVSDPQLRDTVYELVLHTLVVNPAHHEQFLALVRRWPKTIYSVPTIISDIKNQCNTGGRTPYLLEALAELYLFQQEYDNVLNIHLELQKPSAFDIIKEHHLYTALHGKIGLLLKIDAKRAINLLVELRGKITPREVVSVLERSVSDRESRRLILDYLRALYDSDKRIGKDYHDLQVELYAELEPNALQWFLRDCQYYSLNKAYDVCTKRNLVSEKVYLLGQMGNNKEALSVIINDLRNMEQAVEFVTSRNDDELWGELLNMSLRVPEMAGALLDHSLGNIEPMHVIKMISHDMPIPRLRDRLVKVFTDYKTEASLRRGCNSILKADRVNLQLKRYNLALCSVLGEKSSCSICSDSLASQNVAVVTFFCGHFYHATCLQDSSDTSSAPSSPRGFFTVSKQEQQEPQEEDESYRCVLCTEESQRRRKKANGFVL